MIGRAMQRFVAVIGAGILLVASSTRGAAQNLPAGFDQTYAISSLNQELSVEADAVVRLDLQRFEVHNPGKATQTSRRAVTVLTEEGRDEGELHILYDDRLRRLEKLVGRIFDANGNLVRTLRKEDQEDFSAISDYTLYEDERVRVARLVHHSYPYTVEFEYEIRHDGLINWPTWYPQEKGMAVVFGRFDLVTPERVDARYTVTGATLEPTVVVQKKKRTLRWEVKGEPPLQVEPFGPVWQKQVIAVYTAPETFEVEGMQGDMRSWQSFGQWYHTLNATRGGLPINARVDIHRLTSDVSDVREKARALYAYMQDKTRYVSIQLGLGGWQTFDAEYVHKRGYGDCKALTNYMQALLREAGIASFPALIQGGARAAGILPDFPSNQFNHVILYVDLGNGEGMWLENTDQTIPFGHLGTFTEDRYALVIKPEGGELMRTPKSDAHQNQRVLHARVRLGPTGDASADIQMQHTGNEQDRIRGGLTNRSGREREKWLFEYLDVSSFEIVSADFSALDARASSVPSSLTLALPHYAARTGRRLFVPINPFDRWTYIPPPVEPRTQPVEFFPYAYATADTVRYELPEGFAVEALPDPVEIETPFGKYAARAEVESDGTLVYTRLIEVTEPTFPAEDYDAFREAMRAIAQADRGQVVLVEG